MVSIVERLSGGLKKPVEENELDLRALYFNEMEKPLTKEEEKDRFQKIVRARASYALLKLVRPRGLGEDREIKAFLPQAYAENFLSEFGLSEFMGIVDNEPDPEEMSEHAHRKWGAQGDKKFVFLNPNIVPLINIDHIEQFKKWHQEGKDAFDEIVLRNRRFVFKIAEKYLFLGIEELDLNEEGILGLIRASQKFDITKENKFSTYAKRWIEQKILLAIKEKNHAVHMSCDIQEKYSAFLQRTESLAKELGRWPTIEDLTGAGYSLEELEKFEIIKKLSQQVTLYKQVYRKDEDDEFCLIDVVPDKLAENPSDVVEREFIKEKIQEFKKMLQEREIPGITIEERRAVLYRFGLDLENSNNYGEEMTCVQVGDIMGIGHRRAQRLIRSALAKIRKFKEVKELLELVYV